MIDLSLSDFFDIAKGVIGAGIFGLIIWIWRRWKKKRDVKRIKDEEYIEYLKEDIERRFKAGFEMFWQYLAALVLLYIAFETFPSQAEFEAKPDAWDIFFILNRIFIFIVQNVFAGILFVRGYKTGKLLYFAWSDLGHSK